MHKYEKIKLNYAQETPLSAIACTRPHTSVDESDTTDVSVIVNVPGNLILNSCCINLADACNLVEIDKRG